MKYLGIDYGKRKVGLAISEGISASPLKTLTIASLNDAVHQILIILEKESIEQIVIGLSESGESRKITESFIKELKQKTNIPIIQTEETLSSYHSAQKLLSLGKSKKDRKVDDAVAAQIILEEYLERKDYVSS